MQLFYNIEFSNQNQGVGRHLPDGLPVSSDLLILAPAWYRENWSHKEDVYSQLWVDVG